MVPEEDVSNILLYKYERRVRGWRTYDGGAMILDVLHPCGRDIPSG